MDLNLIYSDKRFGTVNSSNISDARTQFQRDFDRIIFSSAFRRLQNKTQVFPLPGSVFVHNRLTHSLEVASVGRSLGSLAGDFIVDTYASQLTDASKDFYKHSLYNVIAAACLCHDIGNPAFGHSGEDAIASYFQKNKTELQPLFSENEWQDFVHFEGNANAIRILTQKQEGKSEDGLQLTFATLASIAKYPCESSGSDNKSTHRKKFGFFQSEISTFAHIAKFTDMVQESSSPMVFLRHPFVWLVEAADDICYNIIDLEDAHRLGIIEHSECLKVLKLLISEIGMDDQARIETRLDSMTDRNDKIAYLRAKSIHALTMQAIEVYKTNFESILKGNFNISLFDQIKNRCEALQQITAFSYQNIYNHRSVVEIENAGYNVMYQLLSHFVPPILLDDAEKTKSDKKALKLIPSQFLYINGSRYQKVMGVLDYVSGMTDNYATDLYRKIKGIEIGMSI